MDVELVQKINKLAVDLLNQGMAQNRIEAVKKAEEMLSRDGSKEISDIQGANPIQNSVAETAAKMAAEGKAEPAKPEPGLDELKQIMLKNNDFIVKSLKSAQEAVAMLQNELTSLKKELAQVKVQAVKAAEAAANAPAPQPQSTLQEVQEKVAIAKPAPAQPAQSSSNHPRQGKYNPEEVAVDKIFYMGNK